ncbi:SOS response-associated peptidase family protein [Bradyrhizobium sp. SYSU BS000235]|uniref:SOS response-associated peptidase family protein n=1 Tax=Bradyrhizobium sp. SYSU BS000235 TaxID=3411332 RepID=UPI003C766E03
MCGRYIIASPPDALRRLFAYGEQPNMPARFNVAPTQPVPVVILENGARHFHLMRWAFMPAWVKDPRQFAVVINARSETVFEKPSFRNAIKRRRCLLPADGYYEWQTARAGKQPFFIHRADGRPVAFAGVAETWSGPNGEEVDTVAIVTAAARPDMAVLHDRVPVTIDPDDFERWLDSNATENEILSLMVAPAEGTFIWHAVSRAVNSVANDGPGLIVPLSAEEIAASEAVADAPPKKPRNSAAQPKSSSKPAPPPKEDDAQGSLF